MTLKLKVLSGLKWSAAGKLLGQIISWISTIVVIRMLEPSDYGLMSLSIIFTSLCYVLSQMGLGSAIVQSKKSGDDGVEAPVENLLELVFGLSKRFVTYSRQTVFIHILPKSIKNHLELNIILISECPNFSLKEGILQLVNFFLLPSHGHIT